ncbi:LysR family transcriptional regulator [Azospirillum endophyticum]
MNSQQLAYFCKVVEHGSFSRAAAALGFNQSALSRHMRNLEQELGVSLLYRNGRGVVLTENGKRLFARASRIMEELELAKMEAANARTNGVESVVIGLPPTVGRLLVSPLAEELLKTYPQIKLRFVEAFSGSLVEWLDSGRVDLAIVYQSRGGISMNSEQLITERLSIVASAMAPKLEAQTSTTALQDYPLILPSHPHGLRHLVDQVAVRQRMSLRVGIEADSFGSILSLVKANLGVTVLPAAAIQEEVERGELQSSLLVGEEVTRTLALATPTNRPLVMGVSGITKILRRVLKQLENR